MTVDLNVDIGEGGGRDEDLLGIATSANIACGGHAGGGAVLGEALEKAKRAGVAIGAHPGYRDPANFGRVETGEGAVAIAGEVRRQLMDFCAAHGGVPHHVKPHGALYHRADVDPEVARVLCELILEIAPDAWVYAFAGGGFAEAAGDLGLAVCREGFIDRGYAADGRLVPRGVPGAMIESAEAAAAQAVWLAQTGMVATLCVHGDGERAVEVLRTARVALEEAGVVVGGLSPPPPFRTCASS